ADMLLFDTKLTGKAVPLGGTGIAFNWSLLQGRNFAKPWMLAGGINIDNLAEAVAATGASIVDLSSGVENAAGRKDPAKIRALLALAKEM
ncbi:MAG: N-(5'-phosphoribosyl)anthranilate isomerase, partial [Alphaproteobacteria bacterium]|nr:N-(5'-phosphoribosyl)anthranilate isomerase [Alphaproteobacteria bacterium]